MSEAAMTLIGLVTILTLVVALPRWGRHAWRLCPACRRSIHPTATRCPYCTEYIKPSISLKWGFVALLVLPRVVQAQGLALLDCPAVRFFGPACEEVSTEVGVSPPPAAPKLAPKDYPLFPKETLAPSTPPLFVDFLNRGTVESALAYLEWHDRKVEVMRARDHLLKQLITERLKGQSPLP
jgi:hypothetical protein